MADLASPSRRSVVRGAAWSMPVIAVAATAPAHAASPCMNKSALKAISWSSSWTTTSQVGTAPDGTRVTVSAGYTSTLLGPGSLNTQNLTPSNVTATRDAINFVNNSPTSLSLNPSGNFQTVNFSFDRDVYGVTFVIEDIDRSAGNYYDQVYVTGAPEAPAFTPGSLVLGSGTSGDPWRTTTTSGAGDYLATQSVTVTYPTGMTPMRSFSLVFYSTLGPLSSVQHIARLRGMQLRTCA